MATKRGSGKGDLNGEASGAREANQATSKEKKSEEHDTRRSECARVYGSNCLCYD